MFSAKHDMAVVSTNSIDVQGVHQHKRRVRVQKAGAGKSGGAAGGLCRRLARLQDRATDFFVMSMNTRVS